MNNQTRIHQAVLRLLEANSFEHFVIQWPPIWQHFWMWTSQLWWLKAKAIKYTYIITTGSIVPRRNNSKLDERAINSAPIGYWRSRSHLRCRNNFGAVSGFAENFHWWQRAACHTGFWFAWPDAVSSRTSHRTNFLPRTRHWIDIPLMAQHQQLEHLLELATRPDLSDQIGKWMTWLKVEKICRRIRCAPISATFHNSSNFYTSTAKNRSALVSFFHQLDWFSFVVIRKSMDGLAHHPAPVACRV